MNTKRMVLIGLLTAISLIIYIIEAQFPLPLAIPGLKLGFANIITLYAMFSLGAKDTLFILLSRIALAALFSGRLTLLLYSLAGAMASYLILFLIKGLLKPNQIWLAGIFCAMAHICGQLVLAMFLLNSSLVFYYAPILLIGAICSGLITGYCAQLMNQRISYRLL